MFTKFRVLPIDQASPCPFYLVDTNNERVCFIKRTLPLHVVMAMTEAPPTRPANWVEPSVDWDVDCGGIWENCQILPILYDMSEVETGTIDEDIDDYDPFEADKEENIRENNVKKEITTSNVEYSNSSNKIQQSDQYKSNNIKVTIHLQDNPYRVKTDVLIYPINSDLSIDDLKLMQMTHRNVQKELDSIARPIKMGSVYVTSNGGDHTGGVVAKRIYHAVVAGESRLVNDQDIKSATLQALYLADSQKAQSVVMLPCDCGTHDIYQTAISQLGAIRYFQKKNDAKYLSRIYIVMEDEDSKEAFDQYYNRMFEN